MCLLEKLLEGYPVYGLASVIVVNYVFAIIFLIALSWLVVW